MNNEAATTNMDKEPFKPEDWLDNAIVAEEMGHKLCEQAFFEQALRLEERLNQLR